MKVVEVYNTGVASLTLRIVVTTKAYKRANALAYNNHSSTRFSFELIHAGCFDFCFFKNFLRYDYSSEYCFYTSRPE